MSIVQNERTKLFANALDRASTACVAIGVLAPIVAVMYGSQTVSTASAVLLYVGTLFWFLLAVILHAGAQIVLGRLK